MTPWDSLGFERKDWMAWAANGRWKPEVNDTMEKDGV